MNYFEIVNLVFSIVFGILGMLTIHFVFFTIIGIFFNTKYL